MKYFFLLAIVLFYSLNTTAQKRRTTVSIKGEDFYINNSITLKGKAMTA